jgi:hypothetical protein
MSMFRKYQAARKALVNKLTRGDHSLLNRNNTPTITAIRIPSLAGSPKLEPLVFRPENKSVWPSTWILIQGRNALMITITQAMAPMILLLVITRN